MAKKPASSKKTAAQPPKCTCQDPFKCDCGNRPPRPSKGHKWYPETQEWAGKGHKQKGGSGQTADVAKQAITTDVGKTQVAQWQRLPTVLLDEACQKQGRAKPSYSRLVDSRAQQFRFRVLVPHTGKQLPGASDRDLVFLPAIPVENEEQAKQEAALLALLQLTPNLPHERKLPEPYKTTWLHAIAATTKKNDKMKQAPSTAKASPATSTTNTTLSPSQSVESTVTSDVTPAVAAVAKASTNLTMAHAHVSVADQKRKEQELRQLKNDRIHRQEAIQLANRDHPVFLSPKLRRELEAMLRGDNDVARQLLLQGDMDDDYDDDDDNGKEGTLNESAASELQSYVRDRLKQQGFTKAQAKAAFAAVVQPRDLVGLSASNDNMDLYEFIFDECLQWLCIHLEEDQLPEKFDPRGRTLDVLAPTKPTTTAVTSALTSSSSLSTKDSSLDSTTGTSLTNGSQIDDSPPSADAQAFAMQYGIYPMEAKLLLDKATTPEGSSQCSEDLLWDVFCQTAASLGGIDNGSCNDSIGTIDQDIEDGAHQQMLDDELEAIKAIFPDENECRIEYRGQDELFVQLRHSGQENEPDQDVFIIEIVIAKAPRTSPQARNLPYPWVPPKRVLVSRLDNIGSSVAARERWSQQGASLHIQLIQFMQSLPRGEPMLFEISGHIQQLLQDAISGELKYVPLLPVLGGGAPVAIARSNMPPPATTVPIKPTLLSSGTSEGSALPSKQARPRRPRDRSVFWSTEPKRTPPAVAFPSISRDMHQARGSLPAAKARSEFLDMMKAADKGGRVVLVTGDTGCGKTTQIPAFLLEELPMDAKIVVAQPRRLAATGVAARVANERGENRPGTGSVGYVVRGDSAICKSTRLLFCTTGILLRQLQCENALACVTHIVVDEVHERHLDTDVLLGILKGCLSSTPHLRIVLMSATLDADRFAAYWGDNTPRLHIPGRTFPVVDYTLEDVLKLTGYIPPKKGKKKQSNFNNRNVRKKTSWADSEKSDEEENEGTEDGDETDSAVDSSRPEQPSHNIPIEDLVSRIDEASVDYDLLGQLVKSLLRRNKLDEIGSILVFLPGAPEINMAMDVIRRIAKNLPIQLLPLHGGLIPEEQNRVFRPAQKGFTKVILSTNVAETSITIPDCTVVVDSCREKQSSYDPVNRMPLLLERFASKASLKQRRGRAGRVKEGTCYKLISRLTLEKLPEHSEPEIRRCALDQTLLSLLFLGIENGTGNFLQKLLDPPTVESIDSAISSLQKLGAVSEPDQNYGRRSLTPLGMHLAAIPAPPTVGKILVMGCILGCRSAALAMAASMSVGRSPFLRIEPSRRNASSDSEPTMEEMKQTRVTDERAALSKTVGNSDHALIAAAYLEWDGAELGSADRKRFCDRLGLSFNGMREMKQLAEQLSQSLNSVGFIAFSEADCNMKSWRVIRTTAVAAMAPSQIVRVQRPGAKYAETAEGAMEKDGVAKELKFFIRSQSDADQSDAALEKFKGYHGVKEERVFLHPASTNFSVGSFSCPWLVYHELVRTSKPFVRDSTECSTYALLLFGGKVKVQAEKNLILIDDWVHLSAVGRIGALIGGLRRKVDDLLLRKIENPSFDIAQTSEMRMIVKLLIKDGLH